MFFKKTALLFVLIVAFSFFISSCASVGMGVNEEKNNKETENNDMAFNFKLLDLEGNTHQLSDYIGKKVYIKFWGTWCSACVSGLDELVALHDLKLDSDTVVLTIIAPGISGEMSEDNFKKWYKKQGYEFTVLLDPQVTSFVEYNIRAFPTSVYVSSEGILFDTKIGHYSNTLINQKLERFD